MEVIINKDSESGSHAAARVVARRVQRKPNAVIGMATGSTPRGLYKELIRMHQEEGLDFSQVTTFNLDEYMGLPRDHEQSYYRFMWDNLFSQINIKAENVHIPDGMAEDVPATCAAYEQAIIAAGGIDIQILGLGSNGHIGFNEPTSSFGSRTRIKTLTRQTVLDNARFFADDESKVPHHCITMGIGTVMDARMNLLLAFGAHKAHAVAATVEGPVTAIIPASVLQHHSESRIFIDDASAAELTRVDYYRWVLDNKPEWEKAL